MIQKILNKCLEELNSEQPDLSYIRGMIEVLLASQQNDIPVWQTDATISVKPFEKPKDEAAMLDAKARASLDTIKALSKESVETE